jgi:hypothetical protein
MKKLHTPCKICIFAEYDGITQTGCQLHKLDEHRQQGIDILEVYDDEREFFVINGVKCLSWRPENWQWNNLALEIQKQKIHDEIAIHFHVIVFDNNNLEDIKATLSSLNKQVLPPIKITLIRRPNNTLSTHQLADLLTDSKIPWRLEDIHENLTEEQIIDIIVPFVKATVYTVFQAGFEVPQTFFDNLNTKINDEFLYFAMLSPNSTNNGLSVVQQIHTAYQGNKEKSLRTKLEEDKCPFIIPITTILPTFPS